MSLYPAAPVRARLRALAVAEHASVVDLARHLGIDRRTVQRVFTRDWLRSDAADRLAIALGSHPFEIWDSWFSDVPPALPITEERTA